MDSTLIYQAVIQGNQGNVDVNSAFFSDGRIAVYDLVVLTDDRDAMPPYDAVVLASQRLSQQHPTVIQALAQLNDWITVERMRAMNLEVDEAREVPAVVAERFVRELIQ